MDISVAERVPVKFEGEGGTGELSWGQQSIWAELQRAGKTLTMTATRQLGPDATVAQFVDELHFYMSRYQAMRTLLRFEPGGSIRQLVRDEGVAEIDIYSADGGDPEEVAAQVAERNAETAFDYENEWPIRFALVRRGAALTHAIVTFAHHLADATSAMAMFEDQRDRDPVTGEPPRPPGIQPLEQARLQQTPQARRQNEAALRYWEGQLRVIPPTMFPGGPRPSEGCWEVEIFSPAWYQALHSAAARLRVDTGAVLYATFATALARITGVNHVATMITVNNRFRPGLANAAGHMVQHGLCTLDTAGVPLAELAPAARRRLLVAQKNAYYAQIELDALIERVGRERGVEFDLLCLFNDRRIAGDPAEPPREDAAPTTLIWRPLPSLHQRLMLHVNDAPGALSGLLQADTAYFGRADLAALLEQMETLAERER